MYATVTELSFKSTDDLAQATTKLHQLLAAARQLPGFRSLHVIQTEENAAVMVTVYDSVADSESGSSQLRPRIAEAIGPHVVSFPRRVAGTVILHS